MNAPKKGLIVPLAKTKMFNINGLHEAPDAFHILPTHKTIPQSGGGVDISFSLNNKAFVYSVQIITYAILE